MNGILGLVGSVVQALDPGAGLLVGGLESLLGGQNGSQSSGCGSSALGGLASLASSFLGGGDASAATGSIADLLA